MPIKLKPNHGRDKGWTINSHETRQILQWLEEDPANLNKLRKQLGLRPSETYTPVSNKDAPAAPD